jgi:predicted hydrocarbon binding protein
MDTNRRNFLKQTCTAGGCFCGFSAFAGGDGFAAEPKDEDNSRQKMMQEWISILMASVDEHTDESLSRDLLKNCARAHYEHLKMNEFLKPYVGDLEKFIHFIEEKWGWKISYSKEEGVLIADENKNYCVCPMVNKEKGIKSSILCYCSEGFAELMFSDVAGKQVQAKVISSIHRGQDRCQYEIKLN